MQNGVNKSYIGDGVYADFDGYMLKLTTEDGIRATNTVFLELPDWEVLKRYMERTLNKMEAAVDADQAKDTCDIPY